MCSGLSHRQRSGQNGMPNSLSELGIASGASEHGKSADLPGASSQDNICWKWPKRFCLKLRNLNWHICLKMSREMLELSLGNFKSRARLCSSALQVHSGVEKVKAAHILCPLVHTCSSGHCLCIHQNTKTALLICEDWGLRAATSPDGPHCCPGIQCCVLHSLFFPLAHWGVSEGSLLPPMHICAWVV